MGGRHGGPLLSAGFEEAIPDEERRALGQFYTPPHLAEILTWWALPAPSTSPPTVLDPGAGTGIVLAAAYDRLATLYPNADHGTLLDQLVGVDLNPDSLRLAARELEAKRDGAGAPRVYHASFFDLNPDVPPPGSTGIETNDPRSIGRVDAVVGNPPFIRASDLSPDVEYFRRHLSVFGPDGERPYLDGEKRLSGRSDAYVYFVTNATRFLRPGGRLAFVLPTKWLSSDYGEDFTRFLLDHYRVHAVVGFDGRAFDDALVDTCLLLAERCDEPDRRARTTVRFVRLSEPTVAAARRALRADADIGDGAPVISRHDAGRTVAHRQSALGTRKLGRYLTAPADLLQLVDDPAFVRLSALAAVSRGVMTGANRFFFVDDAAVARWDIEARFLSPARKSMRGIDRRAIEPGDVDQYILDVHEYVTGLGEQTSTAQVKRALDRDGHDGLLAYVRHAEAEGWHDGRTCRQRRVWFDLGSLPRPDVFLPKLLRERVFVVANRAGAVPSNAIDCVTVREGVDPLVLVGLLECSLTKAVMEIWGRDEAGMLQLMTYETETLPVPDVREFDPSIRDRIGAAAAGLLEGNDGAREKLDRAVLAPLDLDPSVERVRSLRERLLRRRVEGHDPDTGAAV